MKKLLILLTCIIFTGCSTVMSNKITDDKFEEQLPNNEFDKYKYILSIEDELSEPEYIRIDSIFLEGKNTNEHLINEDVIESILSIYSSYCKNHSTYELVNFLDMHVKKLPQLDLDILLLKIVERIELDYSSYKNVIYDERFGYITQVYTNRITDTFLENYELTIEVKERFDDIEVFIDELRLVINGGYQIRKFNNSYQILPDYASILVRYEDYYSEEANLFVDILVRESRTIVEAGGILQVDNEEIAYKINQLETFMKSYPNSMYYNIVRDIYFDYFEKIVTNVDNTDFITSVNKKYKTSALLDFIEIINRYGNTEMARILNMFVNSIDSNNGFYNAELVDEIKEIILVSY